MGGAAKAVSRSFQEPAGTIMRLPGDISATGKSVGGQISGVGKSAINGIGGFINSIPGKVGLGTYKPDEAAFQQTAEGKQMQKDAQTGQTTAAARNVVSPLRYNPADASKMAAASVDPAQQAQFRVQQAALAQQLIDQGNGVGPSLAQSQLQQGRDANIASAMALAASQRGLTAGQGLRQIADQTTNANQQAADDAARLRLTEQLAARDQLAGVLSGAREQDIGLATTNAGFQQQTNLTNANNQTMINQSNAANRLTADSSNVTNALKQQAQNDAMVQAYMNQGLTLEMAKMKAAQDLEALKAGAYNSGAERTSGFIGGLGQAGATLGSAAIKGPAAGAVGGAGAAAAPAAAASDKRLKKKIKNGDGDIIDLIENLGSHSYEYKDKKFGKGTYASPMAQELEKSKLGQDMVVNTPEGKMVDYARGAGTYLAAAAMLHKRLKKVESSLTKKG